MKKTDVGVVVGLSCTENVIKNMKKCEMRPSARSLRLCRGRLLKTKFDQLVLRYLFLAIEKNIFLLLVKFWKFIKTHYK